MRLCHSLVLEECFEGIKLTSLLGDYKGVFRYLRKYLLGGMYQEWDLYIRVSDRYTLGPLKVHTFNIACNQVTKELVTR